MMSVNLDAEIFLLTTPIVTAAGNAMEARSMKDTISNIAGKILQMVPPAIYICYTSYDKIYHRLWFDNIYENYLFPVPNPGRPSYEAYHKVLSAKTICAEFWTPRITYAIGITTLALPLICKGLSKLTQYYELPKMTVFVRNVEKALMINVKIINIAFVARGILHEDRPSFPLVAYFSFSLISSIYHLVHSNSKED